MPRHRVAEATPEVVDHATVREKIAGPYHGLSTRTLIRVDVMSTGACITARGATLPHALRRAALRIELGNAVGPLEVTDTSRRALRSLLTAIRAMTNARRKVQGGDAVELSNAITHARDVVDDLRRSIGWDIDELGDPPLDSMENRW